MTTIARKLRRTDRTEGGHEPLLTRCRTGRRRPLLIALALPLLAGVGCDSLLDVSNPGQIQERDLNNPALAEVLALGAQGDFECFFTNYIDVAGVWAGELFNTQSRRDVDLLMQRHPSLFQIEGGEDCRGRGGSIAGLPLHTARKQAERAIELIGEFSEAQVPNRDFLIGKATVYAGFTYQIAGETFCELTFDAGPLMTRADGWRIAEERFTSAIQRLGQVTGADAAAAGELIQAARIGRARARLNLGDGAGVLADANQIEEGFVFNSTHSGAAPRLWNQQYEKANLTDVRSAHDDYVDLEVEGVPDPRVPTEFRGAASRAAQPFHAQLKYTDLGTPVPIASWREAQLMIAEVQGGQAAVDVINRLRATWDLPAFSGSDEAGIQAQVREERRRELWLQTGSRIGDMLRWGLPFPSGLDPMGRPYEEDQTCVPLHDRERFNNPNL